jgi:dTDP-4-dehydrorhamnose reductase
MTLKILVLGSTGLIGSTILKVLAESNKFKVRGTVRSSISKALFPKEISDLLTAEVDLINFDNLLNLMQTEMPDVVINAAGLTKHKPESNIALQVLPINAMLPHQLVEMCKKVSARLIHISTDCVFKGDRGLYSEIDIPDAQDLYGRSKSFGEIDIQGHVTIRTSTIGHELNTEYGLLDWFLKQRNACSGYSKAIFSGLPTIELAEVLRDHIIPNHSLSGLYNLASNSINKYDLLTLIASTYRKKIHINIDDSVVIDRSLCGKKFENATGYKAPKWEDLIKKMYMTSDKKYV